MSRSYSELIKLLTFVERFKYLKLNGTVGKDTFGYDRYLNQVLYRSPEWKRLRHKIIVRDNGCDLAISDREIGYGTKILIHHINPITLQDILNLDPKLFDPENLICCSETTHNAIHYGDENLMIMDVTERRPNDTCPWKKVM